jgi:hypothetical protein
MAADPLEAVECSRTTHGSPARHVMHLPTDPPSFLCFFFWGGAVVLPRRASERARAEDGPGRG